MECNETNNPHSINGNHPNSKEYHSNLEHPTHPQKSRSNPKHHTHPQKCHPNPEHHPNLKENHLKEVDHHGH